MPRPTVVFALLFLAMMPASSHAQAVGTGFPLFNSFAQHEVDTINEGNLNVHLDIPIFEKSGRGLPLKYVVSYDALNWYASLDPTNNIYYWTWAGSSWQVGIQALSGFVTYNRVSYPYACNGGGLWQRQNYVYHDPSGGSHLFTSSSVTEADCSGVSHGGGPFYAYDGLGYSLSVDPTLSASISNMEGQLIRPDQGTITDTNGNQINGGVDTLGVTALHISNTSVTYPSPTNPSTFVGATFGYTQMSIQSNFGCSGIADRGNGVVNLLTSITLPDSSHYLFTYEPTPGYPAGNTTGRITSVTLPSGAQITYQYTGGNHGIICADGSVAGLTRTTPDGIWTYTRSVTVQPPVPYTITSSITTLIDPMGNKQVINFGNGDSLETMRQLYTGSTTLLKTIETCYNGASFPCSNGLPGSGGVSQKTVREELPNSSGKVSEVDTFYTTPNGVKLPTDAWEYDFGSRPLVRLSGTPTLHTLGHSPPIFSMIPTIRAHRIRQQYRTGPLQLPFTMAVATR